MVSSTWEMPKGEMARDAPTSDTSGFSAAPLEPCLALRRVSEVPGSKDCEGSPSLHAEATLGARPVTSGTTCLTPGVWLTCKFLSILQSTSLCRLDRRQHKRAQLPLRRVPWASAPHTSLLVYCYY